MTFEFAACVEMSGWMPIDWRPAPEGVDWGGLELPDMISRAGMQGPVSRLQRLSGRTAGDDEGADMCWPLPAKPHRLANASVRA